MKFALSIAWFVATFGVDPTCAQTQKLPVPGQQNPAWTLLKTEELYQKGMIVPSQPVPAPMPNIDARGGTKDSSGNWLIYYDPCHNVRYNMADLRKGRLRAQDLRTGTVYTYAAKKPVPARPKR